MLDRIKALHAEISSLQLTSSEQLEEFRLLFLSKKGIMENAEGIPHRVEC